MRESPPSEFDVIIIGAGAAGLMCAVTAGQRGKKTLILDHADKIGKKIRISGGGYCNFTNLSVSAENFISQNPHFCKSALSRYTADDFMELLTRHHILFHEKKPLQMFCQGSAKQIVNMFSTLCKMNGVSIYLEQSIKNISSNHQDYTITTQTNVFKATSLVIATGGLSIAKMGASDFGYKIAKQFSISCVETRPGLVPLKLSNRLLQQTKSLSGISLNVEVCCADRCFEGDMLFTHRGLSGPVILQISNYWQAKQPIEINLMPHCDVLSQLRKWQKDHPRGSLIKLLAEHLSRRVSQFFYQNYFVQKQNIADYSLAELERIATTLQQWTITPDETLGYKLAEVTCGGVDTNEISSKTFESKQHKGLYFIGEVLDITGWLGGYNFQWAWSSAYCAGQAIH